MHSPIFTSFPLRIVILVNIILASASPRRSELLRAVGFEFEVIPADVEENLPEGIIPSKAVELLAKRKALAVAEHHADDIVIGSDTLVEIDGQVLGKPRNDNEALEMLMLLSGKTHNVHTGVYIAGKGFDCGFTETAQVTFFPISIEEAQQYVSTGDCNDKAGAYAIQGGAMSFVQKICGDYNAIVGLPAARLARILRGLPL